MKNAKKTTAVESKTETTAKLLTVADVARELNIAPKRLRAQLRKHAKDYNAFRKTRFAKGSDAHKNAIAVCKKLIAA